MVYWLRCTLYNCKVPGLILTGDVCWMSYLSLHSCVSTDTSNKGRNAKKRGWTKHFSVYCNTSQQNHKLPNCLKWPISWINTSLKKVSPKTEQPSWRWIYCRADVSDCMWFVIWVNWLFISPNTGMNRNHDDWINNKSLLSICNKPFTYYTSGTITGCI